MREYETTFIVQPEISEEGRNALLEKLDRVLSQEGTSRLELHDHGKRKLAYEIRKFQKGHYLTLVYLDQGKAVPGLERALRLEESVLRYLTVQVSDRVRDVDARKASATEHERIRIEKAAERAAREAEERAAREAEQRAREAELAERESGDASSELAAGVPEEEPSSAEAAEGEQDSEAADEAASASGREA